MVGTTKISLILAAVFLTVLLFRGWLWALENGGETLLGIGLIHAILFLAAFLVFAAVLIVTACKSPTGWLVFIWGAMIVLYGYYPVRVALRRIPIEIDVARERRQQEELAKLLEDKTTTWKRLEPVLNGEAPWPRILRYRRLDIARQFVEAEGFEPDSLNAASLLGKIYFPESDEEPSTEGVAECVAFLLDHGCDPDVTTAHYRSLRGERTSISMLYLAVEQGDTATAGLLLDRGINPFIRTSSQQTTLYSAVGDARNTGIVRRLLDLGLDPDAADCDGHTPLIRAVRESRSPEIVRLLLDFGADVNAAGPDGGTALVHAWSSDTEIVRLLLARGAQADAADNDGRTALFKAMGNSRETVLLLLDNGADLHRKDTSGQMLLMNAARSSDPWFAALCLEAGLDVNEQQEDGLDALWYAVDRENPRVAALLIEKGADAARIYPDGETLLFAAAENDDPGIVALLIAHGADVNRLNKFGYDALYRAVQLSRGASIRALVEHGAKLDRTYPDGKTLGNVAAQSWDEVKRYLREHGVKIQEE